jgi:hypothetical protein
MIFTPKDSDTLKIGHDLFGSFSRAVEELHIPLHPKQVPNPCQFDKNHKVAIQRSNKVANTFESSRE